MKCVGGGPRLLKLASTLDERQGLLLAFYLAWPGSGLVTQERMVTRENTGCTSDRGGGALRAR